MTTPIDYHESVYDRKSPSRRSHYLAGVALIFISFGIVLIIYDAVEFAELKRFDTQPSRCRVTGYEMQKSKKPGSTGIPVWDVDIVKILRNKNSTKRIVIIRSNMKIQGNEQAVWTETAIKHIKQLYSIGKIYPCYHHKELLTNSSMDWHPLRMEQAIRWESVSFDYIISSFTISCLILIIGSLLFFVAYLYYQID